MILEESPIGFTKRDIKKLHGPSQTWLWTRKDKLPIFYLADTNRKIAKGAAIKARRHAYGQR